MRVYLPATMAQLARWHADGAVPADVEPVLASDESEDSEYLALMTAADLSAAQLDGPGRRGVVVADVGDGSGPGPRSRVVAVHAAVCRSHCRPARRGLPARTGRAPRCPEARRGPR